ncbi:MAG: HDOD domain-containing protein [Pseudomonadota bacterium]
MTQSMAPSNSAKIARFEQQLNKHHLPVFDRTLATIKQKLSSKNFKYEQLGNLFHQDPMCLFNFMACANKHALAHSPEFYSSIKTPQHASMLLGIDNIEKCIKKLKPLSQIQDKAVIQKIEQLACRSLHCANQAKHLAHLMHDSAEEEVFLSALMMSLADLLVWYISPRQAQKYELLITDNKNTISTEEAQLKVFGFSFYQFIIQINPQWHLPELYIKTLQTDVFDEVPKSITCIKLADKLSRLVDYGWYYQDLYDHLDYCALVTPFSNQRLSKEFHHVAALMADDMSNLYKQSLPTSALLLEAGKIPYYPVLSREEEQPVNKPQPKKIKPATIVQPITVNKLESASDLPLLIQLTINTLFESGNFEQVVMLMLDKSKMNMTVRLEKSSLNREAIHKKVSIHPNKNLFTLLVQKHQPIFVKASEAEKYTHLLTSPILEVLPGREFFAKGFNYKGKPIGIFYVTHSKSLDEMSYVFFKKTLLRFEQHLNRLT